MKVNDAFRPPSVNNTSKPKITTLDESNARVDKDFMANNRESRGIKSTFEHDNSSISDHKKNGSPFLCIVYYQIIVTDSNKKAAVALSQSRSQSEMRVESQIKVQNRNSTQWNETQKQPRNGNALTKSTNNIFAPQNVKDSDILQSTSLATQQYSAKSRQPSVKHSKSVYQMLRQESNIFIGQDETLLNSSSISGNCAKKIPGGGNKKNESINIFDLNQEENRLNSSNIDDIQLRRSDINSSISPNKQKLAAKTNQSSGVYGAIQGTGEYQDESLQQRRSLSQNKKNLSVLNKIFDHLDGGDPNRNYQSLSRDPIDKDEIMAQRAKKAYKNYQNHHQSKSQILNNQAEIEEASFDKDGQRSNSRSGAANKRNDSSFNMINGVEKTPQKLKLHKKMYNVEISNPIVVDQSADIIETDFGADNNMKSYGQGVNFISKPEDRIQKHQQTIMPQKQKTQIYFEQDNQSIQQAKPQQKSNQSQIFQNNIAQTPINNTKIDFYSPMKDQNQSKTVRIKDQSDNQQKYKISSALSQSLFKQQHNTIDLSDVKEPKSFVDVIGKDHAKNTFDHRSKLQEENRMKVTQQLFNNQRNGREQEKSKLMNDDRNDSIIDTMSGDPRKKNHEAREGSRDRSRSQLRTFTSDIYVESKCVMQNQDSRPLICDDDEKISQRNNDLKRLSSDLKEQITKRLEYLKAEKQRIKQEEQISIDMAMRQEADKKEAEYVQKIEAKHETKAQMMLIEKQKTRQKSQTKIEKMQDRDLIRQIQQKQVGGVLAVGKSSGEADIIVANRDHSIQSPFQNKNISVSNSFILKSDLKTPASNGGLQSQKNISSTITKSKTPSKYQDETRSTRTPDLSSQKKGDRKSMNGRKVGSGYNNAYKQVRAQVLNYSGSISSNNGGIKRSNPNDQLTEKAGEFTFKNKFNE